LDWTAENLTEKVGALLGVDDRAIEHDLRNFKAFIEDVGNADGGWRGTVGGTAGGDTR
jgi:hypothetical protein